MNEDRIVGTSRTLDGKVEQGLGRVMGDAKTQAEGMVDQIAGTAQDLYGQAKEAASTASDVVQSSARGAQDYVRQVVEERPYTVAFVALFVGWLIGRMGRND